MHNHAPPDYACPFCRNVTTGGSDLPLEIVRRYEDVFVKMNPRWWPRNPGGVLVVPLGHFENVYDLPVELGRPIQQAVRDTALAMKTAFGCDGVSTRQHNEPGGDQDVWHYHVHVFPRFVGDQLYGSRGGPADPVALRMAADALRAAWPH